jgi:hypothetical protein
MTMQSLRSSRCARIAFPSIIYWTQQPPRRLGWLVAEIGTILSAATDADDVGLIVYL